MEIIKTGLAGTLESSDLSVVIEPNHDGGIEIVLLSSVEKQFGIQIRKVILETLELLNIKNALVRVNDKGALDCVIKARIETAAYRGADSQNYVWRRINSGKD